MNKTKIIIDTDIGDDADDVLALALAVTLDEIDIVGITTVFKNTRARAQMTNYFLSLVNRADIPVAVGERQPLNSVVDADEIPCQYILDMLSFPIPELDAQTLFKNVLTQDKVKIVCIGPLTNIAKLITTQPELLKNVDELVIMAGCFYTYMSEWNVMCDPEAADIVFKSGLNIRVLGLDVTAKCHLDQRYLDRIDLSNKKNQFLRLMCQKWFDLTGYTPILHDPLTIYALLDNDTLKFREEVVNIELKGEYTKAMTVIRGDYHIWRQQVENANALVAYDVKATDFVDTYFTKVFQQ